MIPAESQRKEKKRGAACVCEEASVVCCVKKCVHVHALAHALLLQDSRRCLLSAACRAKAEREEVEESGRGGAGRQQGGFWELVQRALYCSHGDLSRGLPPPPPYLLHPSGEGGHLAEVAFI